MEDNDFLRNAAFTCREIDTLITSLKSVEVQVVLNAVQFPAVGRGVKVNRLDTDGGTSWIIQILFDNTIANPANPGADNIGYAAVSIIRCERRQPGTGIGIVTIVPPDFLCIILGGVYLIVNGSPVFQFLDSRIALLNSSAVDAGFSKIWNSP